MQFLDILNPVLTHDLPNKNFSRVRHAFSIVISVSSYLLTIALKNIIDRT